MNGGTQTISAITPEAIHRAAFRPTLLRALDYLGGWATAELLMAILEDEPLLAALEQGVSARGAGAQRLARRPTQRAHRRAAAGAALRGSAGAARRASIASPKTSRSCARCMGGWSS